MNYLRGIGQAVLITFLVLVSSVFAQSTLILANEGSPPTFDPLIAGSDSRVNTPSINMYNALTQFVPGSSEIALELAESYEASEDGLSYTFVLKKGVMFHDGTELTADDVKYTADRMLALQTGTARSFGALESVDKVDDYTVKFNLKFAFPAITLALPRLYILNADLVKANEADGDWGQTWLQNNEAGSGPYKLVSFQPEQQFTMEKFDDYFLGWHEGAADRVIFQVIKEQAARRLALENGDADWIHIGSTDTYNALQGAPGIQTFVNNTLNQLYVAMNVNNEYLSNPLVRKALTLVYDYQGHIDFVRGGLGAVAEGPLPPPILCHDTSIGASQTNIEEAKVLMAEAGFPDGGFELGMAYQGTSPEETSTFQILQSGAAEIGITIQPMAMEWPAKVELFSSVETAPALGTVWEFPNYPDPNIFLFEKMHSSRAAGGGFNFSFYAKPEVDALLEQAQVELDEAKRCEIYTQLQQIWLEDNPYINITVGTELSAARDYVENFIYTPSHAFTVNVYPISIANKP